MTTRLRRQWLLRCKPAWGISPRLGAGTHIKLALAFILLTYTAASAGTTEPRLAVMRATAFHSVSGNITLKLEGSFSFGDAVQLGLPLNVLVTQGNLSARVDLAGHAFTSTNGGPEQPALGLGVIGIAQREMTLVLPSGFTAGAAIVQVTGTYEGKPISSNRLSVIL